MRSLTKNLTMLNDILDTFKKVPDIIAISETKLNDNYLSNISIPGYSFLNTKSKTSAGGPGLYLAEELNFIRRCDLELPAEGVESCWIEITSKKEQNVIIGCIYRHPHSHIDSFHEAMKERLQDLNSKGNQVFILGDININFLQYCHDNRTADYLDMLLDSGFMPVITKATRITNHSKTLIDHIYTNVPYKLLKSGICLAGISDHLPVFCTAAHNFQTTNESRFYRDFSKFNKDLFLKVLSFKIFADDTNLFASAKDLKSLELLMNSELKKVKEWCDINKLSINLKKTNFMIIKPQRKKNMNISINITNRDGSCHSLEQKDHIKYLGVMIDSSLSWKYHISYVCAKLSRNIGIISKLRYYLSVNQLKQIYYNLIYPYISYAIVAWGSTCKTNLQKIQTKQNRVIRLIFFATLSGKNTASALPLLNIMDILTVNNVYRLHTLKFTYAWHKGILPKVFDHFFQ